MGSLGFNGETEVLMDIIELFTKNAICYSGYRSGQSPDRGVFPTYEQIKEDLEILNRNWSLIRVYDCEKHSETVLEVIEKEGFDLKVMLGMHLNAEVSNPNCPWGGMYDDERLQENAKQNEANLEKLISMAKRHGESIFAVSVGNEATVGWSDHLVPVEKVIQYAETAKRELDHPVTFCENYIPWADKLDGLAEVVDFISIHTYPAWEYKTIAEALDYTIENYNYVKDKYPHKPVVITEAGWTTRSNGRGIEAWNANQEIQDLYYRALTDWSRKNKILTFVFEAFDEEWKGSEEIHEPEKHWGLFTIDRKPKLVMRTLYGDLY